jgi:3-isopropylmalate/(R)-2-methylmalate dehydratase large subunit
MANTTDNPTFQERKGPESMQANQSRTLLDKVWDSHVVREGEGSDLLYIDVHLTHELTSPQAFEGLRIEGRALRKPDQTLATADHDVPTDRAEEPGEDTLSGRQLRVQRANCDDFGVPLFGMNDPNQGVVHVIGPERGLTLPGTTIVCGDSHTSTHGAFGALAFGIGTSQVEHVMATQTIQMAKPRAMRVTFTGTPGTAVEAKDLALAFIAAHGTAIGTGYSVEFAGPVVRTLSMEGRMTLCNMAIEAGARSGIVAPDEVTIEYLRDKVQLTGEDWEHATTQWLAFHSDADAMFDRELTFDVDGLQPQLTWGTDPSQAFGFGDTVPSLSTMAEPDAQSARGALDYMALNAGQSLEDVEIQTVFIGSCTNGRIEDLRRAAHVLEGRRVASTVRVLVVPGSARVREQAEAEGLDEVFRAAGAEWRTPGCSMCIAMNDDKAPEGTRVASTSNRNFANRQGKRVKTHLMSPSSAAACAVTGRLSVSLASG